MDGLEYLKLNQKKAREYPKLKREGYTSFISFNSEFIKYIRVFEVQNKHLFSGYYDINNVSPDGKKIFALSVSKNSVPGINKAFINIINLETNDIKPIYKVKAWNWQQGSRIRWIDNNTLMFNDYIDNNYKTIVFNLVIGRVVKTYPRAFYDYNDDKKIGLSLNFDRLQFLRPGYGYSNNYAVDIKAMPKNDGIWIYDTKSGEEKLIITYEQLVKKAKINTNKKHYINHISISPNGDKFMFFHIWTKDFLDMWDMEMIVSDLNGNFKVIESEEIVSHYTWVDNDALMVTLVNKDGNCYYIYDLRNYGKKVVKNNDLDNDGHPTFINKDVFITDTYPLINSIQHLYLCNIKNGKTFEILKAFSDPRMYIEKRCDMHPKFDKKTLTINIDSTYKNGERKIIFIKLNNC